ncbi:MAG: discoidin domain-containing protein [Alphaproteobacteria bacterium]|nr:discoidin domain-containing protein [Alphaproteobacteria bacterium]
MGQLLDPFQTNFTSGEQSAELRGRTDITHYYNGAEYLRNVVVLPQGGARRRPGSTYRDRVMRQLTKLDLTGLVSAPEGGTAANAIDDDTATEVVTTSNISTTDPYVILKVDFGAAQTVKAIDVRGLKTSAATVDFDDEVRFQYSLNDSDWTDFGTAFDKVDENDIQRRRAAATAISARYWRLARVGTTDGSTQKFHIDELWMWDETATLSNVREMRFRFSTVQAYIMSLSDRNLAVYKDGVHQADIYVPFTHAQVRETAFIQSLDTMHIFHEDVQPHRIERAGAHDEWNDLTQAFTNIFQHDFGDGDEDTWSATRGWPRCGTYHDGRLWLAGTAQRPQTIWSSKSGDFFNFDDGTGLDAEAIERTLDSDDVASIYNLNSGRHLQVFTESSEWYFLPDKEVLTPDNIKAVRTTNVGTEGPGLPVLKVENATLFVGRRDDAADDSFCSVREFLYTDLENPYEAQDLTLLSSHLIRAPVDFAVLPSTTSRRGALVFVVNNDGTMAVLQTLRRQEITAWQLWITDGNYLSVAVDDQDIYVAVERTIDGVTTQFIERFEWDVYTDAAVIVTSGLPTDTVTGLDHLDGESCEVRADGSVLTNETPSSGSVTIDVAASTRAEVGLGFPDVKEDQVTWLQTQGHTEAEARELVYGNRTQAALGDQVWIRDMPADVRQDGTSLVGFKKRVVEAHLALLQTSGIYIGANNRVPVPVPFQRFGDELLDQAPQLFTGDKSIKGFLGYTLKGQVDITQRSPTGFSLLGMRKRVSL